MVLHILQLSKQTELGMIGDTFDFPILIKMSAEWSWLSISYNTIICVGWKSIFTL